MLILSGLVHAKRWPALMVLLCSFVAVAAVQKREIQSASTDRHARAEAWSHAMPHPSFLLAPLPPTFGAYDPANPVNPTHAAGLVKGPHFSPAALGQSGEGWYAPPVIEPPSAGR
jgi:hypothetical protein